MPRTACFARNILPLFLFTAVLLPLASASGPYVIGSANTVSADPKVTRPSTTPCVVQLFSNAEFDNFNPNSFTYTPPADCPGPWAKVVFEADINVTAGIQFDRTANFWLGPTNIYFGTTAEPSPNLGPSWHVESDLTDYRPIFSNPQQGTADIGNLVNSTFTGIIFASASLEFYPVAKGQTAPVTADEVLALSAGPSGGTVALGSTSSTLSGTFTMPTNVQAAYLDVYAQSQSGDEFWYTCVPSDVASELQSCSNTAFRETEIAIDGQSAGVAPVFPWIFTGGIDPFLWFPIPGVQTLNFTPYRVNLTPFAGLLSNGQPHTVSLSVYNANNYFSATASLLLYLDSGSTQTSGAITQNTLAGPSPVVTEKLNVQPASIKGTVEVTSKRNFAISGYVNTSHGKVTTRVAQTVSFYNHQYFSITGNAYLQDISQGTTVNSYTTVSQPGAANIIDNQNYIFPLSVDISLAFLTNGNINQTTNAKQIYQQTARTAQAGKVTFSSFLENAGQHVDTLELDSSFNLLGNKGQSSAQQYNHYDSTGAAYDCAVSATANALTAFSPGCSQ
ncbi:MAG TPA: peptide-N4-asparagine amidase [Candidatus Polarisedimenticolia bacterium]|nr:peptide-N4-asparagine amidase [Candidatus Polarisedimenticolia bacterium]